jgi:hypothetical protein
MPPADNDDSHRTAAAATYDLSYRRVRARVRRASRRISLPRIIR